MLLDEISRSNLHSVEWQSTELRFERRSCNPPWDTTTNAIQQKQWHGHRQRQI